MECGITKKMNFENLTIEQLHKRTEEYLEIYDHPTAQELLEEYEKENEF